MEKSKNLIYADIIAEGNFRHPLTSHAAGKNPHEGSLSLCSPTPKSKMSPGDKEEGGN